MTRWRAWALAAFMVFLFVYALSVLTPGWPMVAPLGLVGSCCSAAAYLGGGRMTFR